MSIAKFDLRVEKLINKINMSKTSVPGFIMGLSGTDSIVTFLFCYEALKAHQKQDRLYGIHYVDPRRRQDTWFETHIIPWLRETCPDARIEIIPPLTGLNDDEERWLDLVIRSRHSIEHNYQQTTNSFTLETKLLDPSLHYWVVASVNATERNLGTYSILSKSASMWPIATLWKSDILKICEALEVPKIAMDMARLPDCLCGRDELVANHLELIDEILQFKVDPTKYDPELLKSTIAWIKDQKSLYDFKERTPYLI
jgi:NH3-dependent NAD+ synthetase